MRSQGMTTHQRFFRKGKEKPLKLMNKEQRFVDAFSALGSTPLTQEIVDVIEKFVSHMYGYTKLCQAFV